MMDAFIAHLHSIQPMDPSRAAVEFFEPGRFRVVKRDAEKCDTWHYYGDGKSKWLNHLPRYFWRRHVHPSMLEYIPSEFVPAFAEYAAPDAVYYKPISREPLLLVSSLNWQGLAHYLDTVVRENRLA